MDTIPYCLISVATAFAHCGVAGSDGWEWNGMESAAKVRASRAALQPGCPAASFCSSKNGLPASQSTSRTRNPGLGNVSHEELPWKNNDGIELIGCV